MAIRRYWFVSRMDIISDADAQTLGLAAPRGGLLRQPAPAPRLGGGNVLDRNAARDFLQAQQAEPAPEIVIGGAAPATLKIQTKDAPKYLFVSRGAAENYAQKCAAEQPRVPFGVFDCVGIYETSEAPIIQKEFNIDNEVIVK